MSGLFLVIPGCFLLHSWIELIATAVNRRMDQRMQQAIRQVRQQETPTPNRLYHRSSELLPTKYWWFDVSFSLLRQMSEKTRHIVFTSSDFWGSSVSIEIYQKNTLVSAGVVTMAAPGQDGRIKEINIQEYAIRCVYIIYHLSIHIYIYIHIYMCIHIALHRILIFHSWNFDNFGASLPKTFWIIWTAEPQLTQLSTLCLEVQELILKPDILAGNYQ